MTPTLSPKAPPSPDELEVSIFGPGRGECVVLHLGFGEWVVVDSCRNSRTKKPIALQYLEELGVEIGTAVRLVVVTHWHDDHISGVSQVLQEAVTAEFACSAADYPTIFEAVATARSSSLPDSGLDEFSRVFDVLSGRKKAGQRTASVGPRWAAEGMLLFQSSDSASRARVVALGPSPATETLSRRELAGFLAERTKPQRRAVALGPNQRSVVLWVTAGQRSVLLGGDLESSTNPAVGWQAVVASRVRPSGRASLFKVPHHGSGNADHPPVWADLLEARPIALLAPFASGSFSLPAPDDVSRLLTRTDRAYCTTPPRGWKPPKRDPMVERTARDVARNRRAIKGDVGHVRVRMQLAGNGPASVDVRPPALQLT